MAPESHHPPRDDGKRPYQRPRLESYGNIKEITLAVGMTGANDGSTHGNNRTS